LIDGDLDVFDEQITNVTIDKNYTARMANSEISPINCAVE